MQTTSNRAIRQLGVDPSNLSEPSVYDWPVPEEGQAQGVVTHLTLAAFLLGGFQTNPAQIAEFEKIGVATESADRAPWIVRLSPRERTGTVEVRAGSASDDAVHPDVSEKSWIWVDLRRASPLVVTGPQGEALVLADEDRLTVWSLAGIAVEPVATIQAPVQDWLNGARSTDKWLRTEIDRKLNIGGPWANVTAAALVARYLDATEPLLRKTWVDAALECRSVEPLAAPRRWACQLKGNELRTVHELARVEVDRLETALDDVADRAVPEQGSWQAEWLDVCHGRDDLEGVCLLLREADARIPFETRLAQLDRSGRVVRSLLPTGYLPSDERTHRAYQVTPDAWWATR